MTDPTFGLSITRIDNEPRPTIAAIMSVVGILGTAPDADAGEFPLNTPVEVFSNDAAKAALLGDAGASNTIRDALDAINDQLGEFQVSARCVVVRVEEGVDDDATISNMVGDSVAGTGIHAFLAAGEELGVIPRIIIAPGYTHQESDPGVDATNSLVAEMPGVLNKLLGVAIVDGPADRTDLTTWRETISSERIIPVYPNVTIDDGAGGTRNTALAARVAGIAVRRDFEKGGKPFHSWANQPVQGILGPVSKIRFSLTDGATEGQTILAENVGIVVRGQMGVEQAIARGGFVFVGTDTCSDDTLWQFYNQVRGRDYIHLTFLQTLRFYLGKFNITMHTIQAILNTMKSELRSLKADGDILGYKVGFSPDQNTPEDLRAGKFTVSFAAEEPAPLRYLGIESARYRPALDALVNELVAQLDTNVT